MTQVHTYASQYFLHGVGLIDEAASSQASSAAQAAHRPPWRYEPGHTPPWIKKQACSTDAAATAAERNALTPVRIPRSPLVPLGALPEGQSVHGCTTGSMPTRGGSRTLTTPSVTMNELDLRTERLALDLEKAQVEAKRKETLDREGQVAA